MRGEQIIIASELFLRGSAIRKIRQDKGRKTRTILKVIGVFFCKKKREAHNWHAIRYITGNEADFASRDSTVSKFVQLNKEWDESQRQAIGTPNNYEPELWTLKQRARMGKQ